MESSLSQLSAKSGIREGVLAEIVDLAEKYKLNRLLLFGSRARGDYHKTSDIDLAASGGDIISFALDVDEETQTLLKYDVVNLKSSLSQELRQSIEQEGILLYEKI